MKDVTLGLGLKLALVDLPAGAEVDSSPHARDPVLGGDREGQEIGKRGGFGETFSYQREHRAQSQNQSFLIF